MTIRDAVSRVANRLPHPVRELVRTKIPVATWAELQSARRRRPAAVGQRREPAPDGIRWLTDIANGRGLGIMVGKEVEALLAANKVAQAQSTGDSLAAHAETASLGHTLCGLVAAHRRLYPLAADRFGRGDEELAIALAPVEYVVTRFVTDPVGAKCWAQRMLQTPDVLPPTAWWQVIRHTFPARDDAFNRRVLDTLEASHASNPAAWPRGADVLPELERWIGRPNREIRAADHSVVHFGVLDYRQPDWSTASDNIGDWIQTLASLGHLVRHRNVRFASTDPTVEQFITNLQARVRPELARDSAAGQVEVHVVERDASSFQALPEQTWILAFGWYMHPQFIVSGQFDVPFHPAIRPIFVSFHCNNRAMLTVEAVEYLRAYAPIGCRDWTTVDVLLSLGVPAFFSGCLTTTINTVFPDAPLATRERTIYVDAVRNPVPAGAERSKAMYRLVRDRSFVQNLKEALDVLETYRREYTRVVTKRLHCYLPATSLGVEVDFEPGDNTIVRFNGLSGLSRSEFDDMRASLLARLEPVMTAILAARPEQEIYRLWRDLNAEAVRHATNRHQRPTIVSPAVDPLLASLGNVVPPEALAHDDTIDVAVVVPPGHEVHLTGVLASARDRSSRPLRAWIFAASSPARPPGVEIRWIDTSTTVDGGLTLSDLGSLAAALVPADRLILLPLAALVEEDLARLANLDLDGRVLAARRTSSSSSSGFATFYRAATRLDDRPETAFESYRDVHARHRFDFDAFDTALLVLDLAALRRSEGLRQLLHSFVEYRYSAHEAWHYLVGNDYTRLDPAWGYVPTRDRPVAPYVWHWADSTKPWSSPYTPGRDEWRRAQQAGSDGDR